jgi:hypothetical protein
MMCNCRYLKLPPHFSWLNYAKPMETLWSTIVYALVVSLPLNLFSILKLLVACLGLLVCCLKEIYTKLFKLVRAMKSGQLKEELCSWNLEARTLEIHISFYVTVAVTDCCCDWNFSCSLARGKNDSMEFYANSTLLYISVVLCWVL